MTRGDYGTSSINGFQAIEAVEIPLDALANTPIRPNPCEVLVKMVVNRFPR